MLQKRFFGTFIYLSKQIQDCHGKTGIQQKGKDYFCQQDVLKK
jgi:hypothetical protein